MSDEPLTGIVIYEAPDGSARLDVSFDGDTVWLTQAQMADLFDVSTSTISRHLAHIFEEGELEETSVTSNLQNVQINSGRKAKRPTTFYNLDAIISVGYRISSGRATAFRQWATGVLKEYLRKGFALDDERLKNGGGGPYWEELLNRIRDIRSSEKVFYRQVLDLYATAIDYDPTSQDSIRFFKIVQNKLHYAAHGHTAAEVVFERADADKPFMGLTSFKGNEVTKSDVGIAKNYLDEDELPKLNSLVSGYFDFAEFRAHQHVPTYMADYVSQLDALILAAGARALEGAGRISHAQAMEKADHEYRAYQVKTLSGAEKDYLEALKRAEKDLSNREHGHS